MFADHDTSSAVVVCVNETVSESFADSLVLGCVVDAVEPFETEWNLEILDYSGDYPAVEIEDAAVDICRSALEVEWTRGTLMTRMTEPSSCKAAEHITTAFQSFLLRRSFMEVMKAELMIPVGMASMAIPTKLMKAQRMRPT